MVVDGGWITLHSCKKNKKEPSSSPSSSSKRQRTPAPLGQEDGDSSKETNGSDECIVLDTPALTGVSRARRGHVLLLLHNVRRSLFASLSPVARQNISWVARITEQESFSQSCGHSLGPALWNSLLKAGFDVCTDQIRVDCYPRHRIEEVCLVLQRAATAAGSGGPPPADPFEGIVSMTMSRSKSTCRLTVIIDAQQDGTIEQWYWGVEHRSDEVHFEDMVQLRLNHEAAEEIKVLPADINPVADCTAPLSRAYYKLEQVWRDLQALPDDMLRELCKGGTGLDVGASPGGWTQVLVHRFGMKKVIAVDKAVLANRIRTHPAVKHVSSAVECSETATALNITAPYSVVVCDASVLWSELLDMTLQHVFLKTKFCLPALVVFTLKLPFKTLNSIQRRVERIQEKLPRYLTELCDAMYPGNSTNVRTRFSSVHLMANADTERTLIVLFEERGASA
jgi:hypothetical protein